MKTSNKQSFLRRGSVAKRLALLTMFGVGFVLPGLNNIALANYGGYSAGSVKADGAVSGYEVLTGCDTAGTAQSLTISDFTTSSGNAYWAKNKTTIYGGNYVVLKGSDNNNYTFKVVEYSSSNSTSGVVTLWNYGWNSTAGTGVNGRFQITTFGANATYSTSKLREFMTSSVATILSNYTGAMVAYTASGAAAGESTNGIAANGDLIWAPFSSEVEALSSESITRADGSSAWLRSYINTSSAYIVYDDGTLYGDYVNNYDRVRPALQLKIASINPIAFTSDAANITATTMTTGNAGSHEYGMDGSKTATFTPTSGVILDNLSINVTADGGGYAAAGLLTTNTGTAWSDISGAISHMATGTTFNLTNADATDRVLRIFGVDVTNKKVTELATGAIAGLSKGSDGKIHMKVSSTLNDGVGITLKNGAVVDLAGDASNAITTVASDTGTLNLGTYTYSGTITNGGTLGVKADAAGGTLASNVTSGTLEITGGLVKYTNANAIGTKTVIKNGAKLDPAANLLNPDTTVESGGELYISTGTLGVDIKGEGTTYIKDLGNPSTSQTITVNSDRSIEGTLNGSGNTVDMTGDTALKTFTIGTLAGTTNLKIDVDMSSFTADKLTVAAVIDTPVVNLTNINVTADYDFSGGIELPKSDSNKVTYVDGDGASGITYNITQRPSVITGNAIVYTGNYKYTFTKGTAGTLSYKVEAADVTFEKLVKGELASGTLSLTADFVNGAAAGDITQGTKTTPITVNLNGHNLTSTNSSNIVVGTDKTFNLNGGSTTAGTTDDKTNFNVVSGGTLAISGKTTMAGVISGAGTVTNSGTLTIEDASKIQVTGTNGIGNSDTINLGGTSASILGGKISGGTLNINGDVTANAGYIAGATNTIAENKTLTLTDGTLGGTLSGKGKVVVDGIVTSEVDKFTQTGGLAVKDSDDVLTLIAGTLSKDVTNNGTVKLEGATLGGKHVTAGTLEFAKDIITNADYIAAATNKVDSGVTLTLIEGTLAKDVTNSGTVKTEGDRVISGALKGGTTGKLLVETGNLVYNNNNNQSITNNVEIKFGATMYSNAGAFGGGTKVSNFGTLVTTGNNLYGSIEGKGRDVLAVTDNLSFAETGAVSQTDSSAIVVPVTVIKSDANTAEKALFKDVANKNQLDVKDGKLIIVGQVTDGQYYVLVAGDAVANEDLTSADLWKKENITLDTSKYFLADYDYVTSDNAIAVKVQGATVQEVNTSGLAAVQQGALAVSKEFTGDVENHLGMIANPKLAEKDKYGKEIWASYIRTKETTEGMKLGAGIEGNNTAQYNGAVVGVDFYSSKKSIAGMALSYVDGNINSHSGDTSTKNDAKYYGVSFYDRVTNGNTALIYDIGYIRGNNDVSQYYNGKAMTSDVKTNTYTAGARWETAIETGKSRVVPFAAFRYMRVNNGDYTNSHNTRFETKNQNLYIPKVGIAWTGDFAMPQSAWTWRPSVEVGYIWNLGDRSANSNVLVGTKIADIGYDVADKSSYYAKAGMEFKCKNFTAGLSYRYLKGDAVRNNKWNINMAWSF